MTKAHFQDIFIINYTAIISMISHYYCVGYIVQMGWRNISQLFFSIS